ncbi:hypothetical protein CHS0354_008517 [Potamilus streckersoni]|uniref:Uncharacterized protein n=1 Tax=Potamilus streckersoni TaxID=2493646 RepID=A0AAE0VR54_9BIVA|nr:hypothetical protein CHS0354_008517 [Potamilus streckersoni]
MMLAVSATRSDNPLIQRDSVRCMVDVIDDDIQHTVGMILAVNPQRNNLINGKKNQLDEVITKTLQAERNQWKERLQTAMHEIDRQHRILLNTQREIQELMKGIQSNLKRSTPSILEEDEEEGDREMDQEFIMHRFIESLKFQIRQLKVKAGVVNASMADFEKAHTKHQHSIQALEESLEKLKWQNKDYQIQIEEKNHKIVWLTSELKSLKREAQKLQLIVKRYNESHNGSNFHFNEMEIPRTARLLDKSPTSGLSIRERTYVEGDQLLSYPVPGEEMSMWKLRLKKQIYSNRNGNSHTGVAQCLRCQQFFKPPENHYKACQFHHKGREIKEHYDENGKLERVVYKWSCCRKPLDAPGKYNPAQTSIINKTIFSEDTIREEEINSNMGREVSLVSRHMWSKPPKEMQLSWKIIFELHGIYACKFSNKMYHLHSGQREITL